MSKIVFGAGASHNTLMNTHWAQVDHLPRAHAFREALGIARDRLLESRPDAVVIVGSNHFRGFWLDLIPPFTIGIDEVISSGEHGTPAGQLRTDPVLANGVCESLLAQGIDMSFSAAMTIDHGISHAVQWIVGVDGPPVLPIVINCFAPPLPTLARCRQLGAALKVALQSAPGLRRIAVIATGGLSHQLPFPDWRRPETDDDVFLADSWRHGRTRWRDYEARRREIVVNAPARINEAFDRQFLTAFGSGALAAATEELEGEALAATAGNGGNEIRAWLIMAEILGHGGGETVCYSPMPEWLTGMAVAIAKPPQPDGDPLVDVD